MSALGLVTPPGDRAAYEQREQVAAAAVVLSRAGLVEAFGHVSARTAGGFVITSTAPLLGARAEGLIELDASGDAGADEESRCPKEAPLHAAIYAARADIGAICRTHSPAAILWGAAGEAPPLIHGLGGLSGSLACHDDPQLITSADAARAAASALAGHDCLLLRANGGVCTARDLRGAVVRAWFLEERARVAAQFRGTGSMSSSEVSERAIHYPAEEARAWQWLCARFQGHRAHSPLTNEPPGDAP